VQPYNLQSAFVSQAPRRREYSFVSDYLRDESHAFNRIGDEVCDFERAFQPDHDILCQRASVHFPFQFIQHLSIDATISISIAVIVGDDDEPDGVGAVGVPLRAPLFSADVISERLEVVSVESQFDKFRADDRSF